MHNIKYGPFGVKDKLGVKVADLFNVKSVKEDGLKIIEHNIAQFKLIVNEPQSIK